MIPAEESIPPVFERCLGDRRDGLFGFRSLESSSPLSLVTVTMTVIVIMILIEARSP